MTDINQFVYNLMTESTGTNILDSGGGSGRHWQRNQKLTLEDFEAQDEVTVDNFEGDQVETSADVMYTVSLFKYLTKALDTDSLCDEFNSMAVADWDSDEAYGLSTAGEQWLREHGMTVEDTWNSYNGESNLSQVVQGATLGHENGFDVSTDYVLLQIHGGADVRGGYTDAKLFVVRNDYFDTNPTVYGVIDGVQVESGYNGYSLTDETGENVPAKNDSEIELELGEY